MDKISCLFKTNYRNSSCADMNKWNKPFRPPILWHRTNHTSDKSKHLILGNIVSSSAAVIWFGNTSMLPRKRPLFKKKRHKPHFRPWHLSVTVKNTAWIMVIYQPELRKNGSILKLNTQRKTKKQLCLPPNSHFVGWYDFAHSHYNAASGSVLISLISLQSIVCLWRRPRRALRGRSPVHLWVGRFIHAARFGWTCASTLKFTLSLVKSVTLLMVTQENIQIATQSPTAEKGW